MPPPAFYGFMLCAVALLGAVLRDDDGFLPIVDHVNLAFHEAGHPLLGLLGERIGLYGGTLLQLLVPVVVALSFALRRDALGTAAGALWTSQSLCNVAPYMADARSQALPLVGGGEHDWALILEAWGLLAWDTRLAGFVRFVGLLGMLAAVAWLTWRVRVER